MVKKKGRTNLDHAQLALREISKLDLLHRHRLTSAPVERLIDRAERSFADAIAESLFSSSHRHISLTFLFSKSAEGEFGSRHPSGRRAFALAGQPFRQRPLG